SLIVCIYEFKPICSLKHLVVSIAKKPIDIALVKQHPDFGNRNLEFCIRKRRRVPLNNNSGSSVCSDRGDFNSAYREFDLPERLLGYRVNKGCAFLESSKPHALF